MEAKAEESSRNLKTKVKSRYKKILKRYRKGEYDAVSDINSDCYKYLTRIMEVVDSVRDDTYEMEVLAGNVFNEIKGSEVFYVKMKHTSKLLEDLLPYTKNEEFARFIEPFVENLRPFFTDRIASHLLEKIILESGKRYLTLPESREQEPCGTWFEILIKVARFALNNLESFIWHSSSNHVTRTILSVLSGNAVNFEQKTNIPSEFQSLLLKFAQKIICLPQFNELCEQTLTSGLLQTLLIATKNLSDTCKTIIKRIIQEYKVRPPDLMEESNEPVLRLIEVILEVANEKQAKKVYEKLFAHNLKGLSVSERGNFAVQKLIKYCKNKEQFEVILDKLMQAAEDILEAGNTGVLLELAKGCVKFKTKQGEYVKMMLQILKCKKTLNEDSDISPLTCCMVTSDIYDPETMKINLHGTLIVQQMLNFSKPIKIINSLLNMEIKQLLQVISDPRGCHIVDAFIQSQFVGEKSRDKLFKVLKGYYTQLAISKYGSRSLDAIWSGITTKNRVLLLEELKQNESELTSSQFGRLVARKTCLNHFRRNKEDWMQREKSLSTTKKFFSDIIPAKKPKLNEE